jgi:UDP-N-acetylmuramoyl-L-alanyl-D-glutamate--2,6-diaminopimelate ligase
LAWSLKAGLNISRVRDAVAGFKYVPGRLEGVETGRGFSVFVDYAHTEDALNNILRSLREVSQERIIVVFGCGGDRDKTKRPKMGRVATELADFAVITSDNPRSEEPLDIIRDIEAGIIKDNYCIVPERATAIKKALSLAKNGDIVLIAGKGHENYQVFKNKTVHFDDREAVSACLR